MFFFFQADVYSQFSKANFTLLRGLMYQINSIEDNYLCLFVLPTNLPTWPSDDVTPGIPVISYSSKRFFFQVA